VEACLLTEEEKHRLCQVVTKAGADYIKTSTGFGAGGATEEDVNNLIAEIQRRVLAHSGIALEPEVIRF